MRVPLITPNSPPSRKAVPASRLALHPEGTFTATFVAWGEIKQSDVNPSRFHMRGWFETEHGPVYIIYSGTPDTFMFMRTHPTLPSYAVQVTHEWHDGRPYILARIVYDNELRRAATEPAS